MGRCCVIVDDFDREAIRRCIYQLYEAKEHVTLTKLLVKNLKDDATFDLGNSTRVIAFCREAVITVQIDEADGLSVCHR